MMVACTPGEIQNAVATVVGEDNVIGDPGRLASYFLAKVEPSELRAAFPASTEDVQKVVRYCSAHRVPIFTSYETYFPDEVAAKKGLILDFHRMNAIERIDTKNLCAHLQRGVTFEQLEEALRPEGLTALYPAAAQTRSVVCHAVSRGINLAAAKYPEVQVSNMQVVLQDGSIHLTGSHANAEDMADWKEDGGPNISKWYLGADDVFGIVVRGSIWVYPRVQGRFFDAFGFNEPRKVLTLVKELPRMELTAECLAMNRPAMARRFQLPEEALTPWTIIVGVEAFMELARYQRRKVAEAVKGEGGAPLASELEDRIANGMERPWYVQPKTYIAYHTLFNRIPEFEALLSTAVQKEHLSVHSIGTTYLAHGLGRAVYCQYDLPQSSVNGAFRQNLERQLTSAGAFFDRPQGDLAERVYGTIPAYVAHLKKIKAMMDEHGIFNPGRPVKEM